VIVVADTSPLKYLIRLGHGFRASASIEATMLARYESAKK